MSTHPDFLFGKMNHFDERLKRHQAEWQGIRHDMQLSPPNPLPETPFTITVRTAGPVAYQTVRCWFTTDGSIPTQASNHIDLQKVTGDWSLLAWDYAAVWQTQVSGYPRGTYFRYRIGARALGQEAWTFADHQAGEIEKATPFALIFDHYERPAWAREAIVYQIFLDRFYPGDNVSWTDPGSLSGIYGGTLRGAIQKLDYIQALGCNAVWLSPIFASNSHHRYDAYDYYKVEPRIGSNEEFQAFIDAAHRRDIRVIMDFVANHWSNEHFTMREAQADRNSPYYGWYDWIEWPHNYHTFFGVMTMPRLRLEHPGARQYLYECAQYWLKQGVDGFRLDHAHGPSIDFWAGFRKACRAINPDCWLFGEVTEGANSQLGFSNVMDGLCDFLLTNALRQTFALENWSLSQFEAFWSSNNSYLSDKIMLPSFIDNHDMNRFLFASGGDKGRLKVAALVLLTLPGPPILYNGTESGETQERSIHNNDFGIYEEARQPMNWDERFDHSLLAYFQRLAQLRRTHPIIWQGQREAVYLNEAKGCLGYIYAEPAGPPQLLILINRSTTSQTISLANPGIKGSLRDHLHEQTITREGATITVTLAPQSGAFIGPG